MKVPSTSAERALSFLLVLALFVSIPIQRGGLGLSWDTLNHHVYLGWVASGARFSQDYFAAGSQSYQFPYLYWPIYQMMRLEWPGWLAGLTWASLHALVSWPLWHCARSFIRDQSTDASVFRVASVLFGVAGLLVLRAPETTGNDVLAALPLVWGFALALRQIGADTTAPGFSSMGAAAAVIGFLGGLAAALKLSNAVLAPILPLVCLAWPTRWFARCGLGLLSGVAVAIGFAVTYGWWGWQLWLHFGNPVFPFFDAGFAPLREALAWVPAR